MGTARVEVAAGGRIDWARYITGENGLASAFSRIRHRDGGQKGLRIGVFGVRIEMSVRSHLHDLPEIHHRDTIAEVLHDGQVMRNNNV